MRGKFFFSLFFLILGILLILVKQTTFAAYENISCPNRYVTLINPVRGRNLWYDKSLKPIEDQYKEVSKYNFPATWLIQFDVLKDSELLERIKKFSSNQEVGLFLEVSEKFAMHSRVIYPYDAAWFDPRAIFLSGYSQSERRLLIDKAMTEFRKEFGFSPRSVGAWWIDSYSLQFLKDKYKIKTVLIVADQLTTDNYGVWGQWWGVPYYPSKANVLVPANSASNKLDVVVVQWAQRDPMLAYGESPRYSNYSLQANDYIRQQKDTEYFKTVSGAFLDCQNPIGQITVGLETGIESVGYQKEYQNQLEYLNSLKSVKALTMSDFADVFTDIYPTPPKMIKIGSWELTPNYRKNLELNDYIGYDAFLAFPDFFLPDRSNFLNRRLINEQGNSLNKGFDGLYILLGLCIAIMAWLKNYLSIFLISILFSVNSFGLVFRSHSFYGWRVFYGPVVTNVEITKVILIVVPFIILLLVTKLFSRKKSLFFLYAIPVSFALDPIAELFRFSFISNKYYFLFSIDALWHAGVSFSKERWIELVNRDFPSYQAAALLRVDYNKMWDNMWISLIFYPLIHLFLSIIICSILLKLPYKFRNTLLILLVALLLWNIVTVFEKNPRVILPDN